MPLADPEARAAYNRAWVEAHRERSRQIKHAYKKRNYARLYADELRRRRGPDGRDKKYREKRKEFQRDYLYRRFYGITTADYESLLAKQEGLCALCRRPPKKVRLHVDHDHKTNRVRGLLCWYCNHALGYFRDDPDVLEKAARYLRQCS